MPAPVRKHLIRASGYFFVSIVTGLAVYQTPPSSLNEFWTWIWQPGLQGLLAALGSLGLNQAVK